MDPTTRLRIATRIHFALRRHYDEDVSVATLLSGEGDALEALWVCEASGDDELVALARRFNETTRQAAALEAQAQARAPFDTPARAAVAQDLAWAQDTSGFGLSRPIETAAPLPARKPGGWLGSWFGSARAR